MRMTNFIISKEDLAYSSVMSLLNSRKYQRKVNDNIFIERQS